MRLWFSLSWEEKKLVFYPDEVDNSWCFHGAGYSTAHYSCLSFTDHMFAVCGGSSSSFLGTVKSGLHFLHLLLQHLFLLGQLLVTAQEVKQRQLKNHGCTKPVSCVCMHRQLTPWPGCGAPRSPRPVFGCCPPCSPPSASASSPPPGAFGCSSEGRQHNKPALTSHWGKTHTENIHCF